MLHSKWREKVLSRLTSRWPRDSMWPAVQSESQGNSKAKTMHEAC